MVFLVSIYDPNYAFLTDLIIYWPISAAALILTLVFLIGRASK